MGSKTMTDNTHDNFRYILREMVECVKNNLSADHEMTAEERAVEKFCKDMIKDFACRITREVGRMEGAILAFCDCFTLVYPPDDKDCPALLASAFDMLRERLGIETVRAVEEGAAQ